jgi:hypothetical protein
LLLATRANTVPKPSLRAFRGLTPFAENPAPPRMRRAFVQFSRLVVSSVGAYSAPISLATVISLVVHVPESER